MSETKSCCPPNSWPALILDKDREQSGKVIDLTDDLKVYVTGSSESKKGILVIYDVHGFEGGRIRSVCDALAEDSDAVVCLPDIYGQSQGVNDYGGFMAPEGQAFLKKYTWDFIEKQCEPLYQHMTTTLGCNQMTVYGFCWGVWVAFHFGKQTLADGVTPRFSIIGGAHPSLGAGTMLFNESLETQLQGIKQHVILCPAGNDPDYTKADGQVQTTIVQNGGKCDIHEFAEMKHGWVPRGDATEAHVARDVKGALAVLSAPVKALL